MSDGFVYLLHFERPLSDRHTSQHYIGYAFCLATRIQQHAHGCGSRFCQVAKERANRFTLVRCWRGGRQFERRLKNRKNAKFLCPICKPNRQMFFNELSSDQIQDLVVPF